MMTMSLYKSGSEFKRIAYLIESLTRNSLIAKASALEPVEVRAYTYDQELPKCSR